MAKWIIETLVKLVVYGYGIRIAFGVMALKDRQLVLQTPVLNSACSPRSREWSHFLVSLYGNTKLQSASTDSRLTELMVWQDL